MAIFQVKQRINTVYLNDQGEEVHVTEVVNNKSPLSKFKDLVQVGIIVKYLRSTRGVYL